jgi:hypothetical protein
MCYVRTGISHLRRQEAPQPAHAVDFTYLVGDALFEGPAVATVLHGSEGDRWLHLPCNGQTGLSQLTLSLFRP